VANGHICITIHFCGLVLICALLISINSQTIDLKCEFCRYLFSYKHSFAANVKTCFCLSPCCEAVKSCKSFVCKLYTLIFCLPVLLENLAVPQAGFSVISANFTPRDPVLGIGACKVRIFWHPSTGCPACVSHKLDLFCLNILTIWHNFSFTVVTHVCLLVHCVQRSRCFLLKGRRLLLWYPFLGIL